MTPEPNPTVADKDLVALFSHLLDEKQLSLVHTPAKPDPMRDALAKIDQFVGEYVTEPEDVSRYKAFVSHVAAELASGQVALAMADDMQRMAAGDGWFGRNVVYRYEHLRTAIPLRAAMRDTGVAAGVELKLMAKEKEETIKNRIREAGFASTKREHEVTTWIEERKATVSLMSSDTPEGHQAIMAKLSAKAAAKAAEQANRYELDRIRVNSKAAVDLVMAQGEVDVKIAEAQGAAESEERHLKMVLDSGPDLERIMHQIHLSPEAFNERSANAMRLAYKKYAEVMSEIDPAAQKALANDFWKIIVGGTQQGLQEMNHVYGV